MPEDKDQEHIESLNDIDFNFDEPEEDTDNVDSADDSMADDSDDSDSTGDDQGSSEDEETESTEENGSGDSESETSEDSDEDEEDSDAEDDDEDEQTFTIDNETISLADLKESHQLRKAAQEAIQKANQHTELANNVVKRVVNNPAEALLDLFSHVYAGDSKKAYDHVVGISEQIVAQHLKFEGLPQEARDAMLAQQENARLKRELEQSKQEAQRRKAAEEETALAKQYAEDISSALTSVKLEPSSASIAAVAEIMLQASEAGLNVTAAQAAKKYNRALNKQKAQFLSTLDPDELPPDVLKKIQKAEVKRAKKREKAKTVGERKSSSKSRSKDAPIITSMSDFASHFNVD